MSLDLVGVPNEFQSVWGRVWTEEYRKFRHMRFKTAHQLVHHDRNTLKIIEPFDLARVESPSVWNVNGTVCIDWVFLLSSVSSEPGDSELLARGCLYSVDLSTPLRQSQNKQYCRHRTRFFFSKVEELQVNQVRIRD